MIEPGSSSLTAERIGEDAEVEKAIDFDLLRQELSKEIIERPQVVGRTSGKGGAIRLGCWTANASFLAVSSGAV